MIRTSSLPVICIAIYAASMVYVIELSSVRAWQSDFAMCIGLSDRCESMAVVGRLMPGRIAVLRPQSPFASLGVGVGGHGFFGVRACR